MTETEDLKRKIAILENDVSQTEEAAESWYNIIKEVVELAERDPQKALKRLRELKSIIIIPKSGVLTKR